MKFFKNLGKEKFRVKLKMSPFKSLSELIESLLEKIIGPKTNEKLDTIIQQQLLILTDLNAIKRFLGLEEIKATDLKIHLGQPKDKV